MADRNLVSISKVRTDGGTQARAVIRQDVVDEYAEAVARGVELPQLVAFEDEGGNLWLADGFHRIAGYKKAGKSSAPLDVRKGSLRDAQLYAVGCNDAHGLRRSNEDKRAAVQMLLKDDDWSKASDRWIAEQCRVSHDLVAAVRKGSTGDSASSRNGESGNSQTRTGKDGKERPASNRALCNRCQRVGKVKNCPACADLNRKGAKTKRPRKVKARDPLKDPYGTDIPRRCRDAWADPWIQETFDLLTTTSEKVRMAFLMDGMKKRAKAYPFFDAKDFSDGVGFVIQYLDSLITHLKDRRPDAVCPSCQGEGCGDCLRSGLVYTGLYRKLKGAAQ